MNSNPTATLWLFAYGGITAQTHLCVLRECLTWHNLAHWVMASDALISRSRSRAASQYLRHPRDTAGDVLLMVDHDITWQQGDLSNIARRAMERNAVVGGIYPKRAFNEGTPIRFDDAGEWKIGEDRLIDAEYVATGFMAIPRSVLHALSETLPWIEEGYWPFFLPMTVLTKRPEKEGWEYLSEDYAFPVAPDTPILDGEWRWRPLESFEVGQTILGVDETSPPHSSRRLDTGFVTAKIEKQAPLWRIVTEAGELNATAEHPWLVKRNWRRPIGYHKWAKPLAPPASWVWTPTADIRPGDYLARVMPPVEAPQQDTDYAAGYVQGVWQGDGHISQDERQCSLRMADHEAILRASQALTRLGIRHHETPLIRRRNPKHQDLHGLGVYHKEYAGRLSRLVRRDAELSHAFAQGYLAGIFDAEGHYNGSSLTISNLDPNIIQRICDVGQRLGFTFARAKRCVVLTGLDNIHRFWITSQPAISRKQPLYGQKGRKEVVHNPLKVLAVEQMRHTGDVMCLTTTMGTFIANSVVSHNCHRARDAGFRAYASTYPRLTHEGNYNYRLVDSLTRPPKDEDINIHLSSAALAAKEGV